MKVIIVGGVAGGASCAARLRRLDEKAEILMVERGPYVSYANCGLPYHVGGSIEQESSLLVATEQMFRGMFAVDCRTRCEVVGISAAEKTVELQEPRDRRGDHREIRQARALARSGTDPSAAARHRSSGNLLGANRAGCQEHPRVAGPGGQGGSVGTGQLHGIPDRDEAEARGGGRRRIHRPGDGGEPGPPRTRSDADREARSGHAAARSGNGDPRPALHGQARRPTRTQ